MPMPTAMPRINRVVFNPLVRRFAGRVPPLAIVVHRGRTSGTSYSTPVMAFPTADGFVIALAYGRNTDWERNVHGAGGCELVARRERHALTNPRLVLQGEAAPCLPGVIRGALRLLRVDDYLRLDHRGDEAGTFRG